MKAHTYHPFDGDLNCLHNQVLTMANLIIEQFDTIVLAINQKSTDLAVKAMQQDNVIDQFEVTIDAEVIEILARQTPLANDLRTIIATSKTVTELERIGDELVKIGGLVIDLYTDEMALPQPKILPEINTIAKVIKAVLDKTIHCIEQCSAQEAYQLIRSEDFCHQELEESLVRQLNMLTREVRLIGPTLDSMQIINGLLRCGTHCISIAEQMVFMLDGEDIRHQKSA
ncbi:phosphate signaling complex protein PhoU [Methylomarinum vadi]|uniref:phosphate signaling complex protein PhoU n=1 Tax=Methylomarinum vadi TaxID=438855 RepID=UPI0004DF8CF9|nr:phosphate signaling complex protein PhoU [Methylomarinum vadi]